MLSAEFAGRVIDYFKKFGVRLGARVAAPKLPRRFRKDGSRSFEPDHLVATARDGAEWGRRSVPLRALPWCGTVERIGLTPADTFPSRAHQEATSRLDTISSLTHPSQRSTLPATRQNNRSASPLDTCNSL